MSINSWRVKTAQQEKRIEWDINVAKPEPSDRARYIEAETRHGGWRLPLTIEVEEAFTCKVPGFEDSKQPFLACNSEGDQMVTAGIPAMGVMVRFVRDIFVRLVVPAKTAEAPTLKTSAKG